MKVIFEFFTSPLSLSIHWAWQYFILLGIGGIAFFIAYAFVGKLYDWDIIYSSKAGSIIHWIVRLLIFVGIWALTRFIIINISKLSFPLWAMILSIAFLVIITLWGIISILKRIFR